MEQEKNPIKQAAGREGARARWVRALQWHRLLEWRRNGTQPDDWRVRQEFVMLRYVFLWRTLGERKSFELWPEVAKQEYKTLAKKYDISPHAAVLWSQAENLLALGRDRIPWFHKHWLQVELEAICGLTKKEKARMETPKQKPKFSKQDIRLGVVLAVRNRMTIKYGKASVRQVQKELAEQHNLRLSIYTVALDLRKLRI